MYKLNGNDNIYCSLWYKWSNYWVVGLCVCRDWQAPRWHFGGRRSGCCRWWSVAGVAPPLALCRSHAAPDHLLQISRYSSWPVIGKLIIRARTDRKFELTEWMLAFQNLHWILHFKTLAILRTRCGFRYVFFVCKHGLATIKKASESSLKFPYVQVRSISLL